MKNKKLIILIVSIVLIFAIFLVYILNLSNGNNLNDAKKFKNEYEFYNDKLANNLQYYPRVNISKDNIVKYASIKDVFDIFNNKEDAVVYFGYADCSYCRHVVQLLLDTAKETKLDVIHYIDITKYWDVKVFDSDNKLITEKEANDGYYQLLDKIGSSFTEDYLILNRNFSYVKTGDKRLKVPLVLFITNGYISSYNIGTLSYHLDPLYDMNEEQKEAVKRTYYYGIRDVVNSKMAKGLLS